MSVVSLMLVKYKKYLDKETLKAPFWKSIAVFDLFFDTFVKTISKKETNYKELQSQIMCMNEAISWLFLSINFYQNIDQDSVSNKNETEEIFDKNKKYILLADLFLSKTMKAFSALEKPFLEKIFYQKITIFYKKSIFKQKSIDSFYLIWYLSFMAIEVLSYVNKKTKLSFFSKYLIKIKGKTNHFNLRKISKGMENYDIFKNSFLRNPQKKGLLNIAYESIIAIMDTKVVKKKK